MARRQPDPTLEYEQMLWTAGVAHPAGLDEAGRGAWAGPVCAAAVILPADPDILQRLAGVRDSKQMTPLQRQRRAEDIRRESLAWGVGFASNQEIDKIGILPATRLAMHRALVGLQPSPQYLVLDALFLPDADLMQTSLVHGDARCLSIAAASVLAKTSRDERMTALAGEFPGYGFERHKGYGTRLHQHNLAQYGPCPAHRHSYAPIARLLAPYGGG